ncbi:unnamed protein product [Meloidogyne enterolobii]|uniref:Uncharacterized protein n=1 Tax=Meloidogyne enterolobii TaxID=390850 RepID=A0ACB0YIH3_MELEN
MKLLNYFISRFLISAHASRMSFIHIPLSFLHAFPFLPFTQTIYIQGKNSRAASR